MQYKRAVLAILASFILAVSSSTAFAEAKIGVSDAQRAILQSEIGKQGMEQINAAFVEQEEQHRHRPLLHHRPRCTRAPRWYSFPLSQ